MGSILRGGFVRLRCYLLSLLRIHRPDCEHCALAKAGDEMRKRLEDLNWRTQSHSPEVAQVFDFADSLSSCQPQGVDSIVSYGDCIPVQLGSDEVIG
jgi:hypothetical protein